MNIKEIRQLAAWIAEAGLSALELKRPGFELLLKRSPVPRQAPLAASGGAADLPLKDNSVKAAHAGLFFSQHPDERSAYIKPGDRVAVGQLLGLLRIDGLYLPVRSHLGGTVVKIQAAEGERVGYGQALVAIEE